MRRIAVIVLLVLATASSSALAQRGGFKARTGPVLCKINGTTCTCWEDKWDEAKGLYTITRACSAEEKKGVSAK